MSGKNKKVHGSLIGVLKEKGAAYVFVVGFLMFWQVMSLVGVIPKFMLPSPIEVLKAFVDDFPLLMDNAGVTLVEAFLGLFFGILLGFLVAIVMERYEFAYKAIYPVLVITQTVPTVAIAPLLVLWFGYEMVPKIILIMIYSFFPITIGLLDGFKSVDKDTLNLMKTMGATPFQSFIHVKLPSSIGYFFAGLRISVSYSIIGAVVAEWLGGLKGLGVYMTRVRKSFSYDKMFAVIFLVSFISLILMYLVKKLQEKMMPWEKKVKEKRSKNFEGMMKKNLKIAILGLVLILAVLCGNNKNWYGKKSEKISIVLDWTPNTNHTGLYVAQELGYFKKEGLENVEIVQPPEGSATELVGVGKVQFGISFADSLAKAFTTDEKIPVTAVAAIIQHNTSGIISLKEKGIDSPKKMENHSYATWESPIEQAIIKKVVTDDGGNYNKIKLIPTEVPDIMKALKTNIDTVWIYYAWDGIKLQTEGIQTNFLKFIDYDKNLDYPSPLIIANNDYLRKNPREAKKVLKAIRKGYEYAIKNPEEAAKILIKYNPEIDRKLAIASQKWLAKEYQAEAKQWGLLDIDKVDKYYSWLYENKLIEKAIPKGFGYSNEYVK